MKIRKIRLIIERNKTSFSDNCDITIERHLNFMSDPRYFILSLRISKWMKDLLGEDDYKTTRNKIEERAKDLYYDKDGAEVKIKL